MEEKEYIDLDEIETSETKDCYVCLEECDHLSPCECQHPVHIHCLQKVRLNNSCCTICRQKYQDEEEEEEEETNIYCAFVLLCPTFYFASGCIGQVLLTLVGIVCGFATAMSQVKDITMFIVWLFSWQFFLSSCGFNLIWALFFCSNRYYC